MGGVLTLRYGGKSNFESMSSVVSFIIYLIILIWMTPSGSSYGHLFESYVRSYEYKVDFTSMKV